MSTQIKDPPEEALKTEPLRKREDNEGIEQNDGGLMSAKHTPKAAGGDAIVR